MKSITIGFSKEKVAPNNTEMYFSDYDLLKMAVNYREKETGFDIDEMMKRLRLTEIIEKVKSEMEIETITDAVLDRTAVLEFEDADFEKMKSLIKGCKWGIVAQAIVNLYKKFENAK